MLAKFGYQPSIRQKIILGYYAIVFIIVSLAIFTLMELRYMENKIAFGETISEFFDTALEIRRFEKNYVIYRQKSDYDENLAYVAKARELLESNLKGFATIAHPGQITALRDGLGNYKTLMERYEKLDPDDVVRKIALEQNIRKAGKDITTIAEDISKAERRHLQAILDKSRNIFTFSIIVLAFAGIIIGQVLSRIIVRPLKLLENSMEAIGGGRFEKIYINSRDREIVSLNKALNKMLKELELRQKHLVQSEKLASLGTLLSGVAHELNNPLSNISLSCQILAEELEERDLEQKKELLSMIDDQTERAKNIVRSLLEFSRDRVFKKEPLPLRKLLEETIRFLKGQVPTRTYISLDIVEDIVIFADKQRIQQVFLNLLKNAVEAIEDEGSIFIAAQYRAAGPSKEEEAGFYARLKQPELCTLEEDTVDIEIADTGPGIPPGILPRIFDPFFTTKDVGKGSGLGLSIVHEIIEEHDGCITAESEVGKGTVFLIRLPMPKKNSSK